ncbi:outer membrane protein [Terriglobus roseus]|nr:hypothetical protein [Terriglobus roseus]
MRREFALAAAAIAGLLLPVASRAQATETATERMHLNVFAVGSYDRPDFGLYVGAGGFAVGGGVGFTVPHLHRIEPSIDLRYNYGTNQAMTQTAFSGGLRVAYNVARFHPYGDLLVGAGNIHFVQTNPAYPDYTHDNSLVYTYGGGVDVDVTRSVALRFDLQEQHWRFSEISPSFYPKQASAGIRYQFHFRNPHGMD